MSDVAQQYLPEFRLAHRRAVVTGAGSSIGKASALALASSADVAITELPERLASSEETVATVRTMGRRGAAFPLDVHEVPRIQASMREAVAELGGLDLVVADAGINVQSEALAVTEQDWDTVVDVNLRGVFFNVQAAVQQILENRRPKQKGRAEPSRPDASVVIVSSQLGMVGLPRGSRAAYGASKGGVINLVRMLAIEWSPHGIQVNSVALATTSGTPMNASLFADPAWRERMLARTRSASSSRRKM